MSDKILSISVAAYNLENMIKENLDSFIKSKFLNDIEIIVTDDESTDDTRKVVKEYAKKYPNSIKLIEQKNGGPGSTVNSGIRHATGKYFKMVDGDDWVDTKNFDKFVEFLKNTNVDMIINNHFVYSDLDRKIIDIYRFENFEKNKTLELQKMKYYPGFSMHDVTYKTEIFKINNIKLDKGFYTDLEYLLLPIKYVNTYIYLDYAIYIYRISREGQSISMSSMRKNIKQHETVLRRLLNLYNKIDNNDNSKNIIGKRLISMIDTHILILLSFKQNRYYKDKIIRLIEYLKINNNELYRELLKIKRERILIKSRYLLYPSISFYFRWKE